MKTTKRIKRPLRIKLNTGLFVIAAIIFAAITFCAATWVAEMNESISGHRHITNQPALCFDAVENDDGTIDRDNGHVCNSGTEETATDPQVLTMFLHEEILFAQDQSATNASVAIVAIGSLFTVASLIGAIIYWNHNKNM